MPAVYPRRERLFALHLSRLMSETSLANEIGPDACWLIQVIANAEDAKFYSGPVAFGNDQLAPLSGCRNVKALARVRDRAVAAGWLYYLPGSKHVYGRYWVTIPDALAPYLGCTTTKSPLLAGSQTGGSESYQDKIDPVDGVVDGRLAGSQTGGSESYQDKIDPVDGVVDGRLAGNVLPFPTPSLPDSEPRAHPSDPSDGARDDQEEIIQTETVGPSVKVVAAHFNSFPGLAHYDPENSPLFNQTIRTWATFNPLWIKHGLDVIAYMGRTPFYCGAGPRGWRAGLPWLLEERNFEKTLSAMMAAKSPVRPEGGNKIINFPTQPPRNSLETARQLSDDSSLGMHPSYLANLAKTKQMISQANSQASNPESSTCTTESTAPTGTQPGSQTTARRSA